MYQHDPYKYLDYRKMELSDLDRVLEIERAAYDFPWSENIFRDCVNSDYECSVILLYQKIIGYCIVSRVLDEAHLLNICMEQECRGHGYGRATLENLLASLKERKMSRIFLEVRPSNLSALALYDSLGFQTIAIRKDYYPANGGREDAMSMLLSLN